MTMPEPARARLYFEDLFSRAFKKELTFDELRTMISRCFEFFNGLMGAQHAWLVGLRRGARFHRLQNYEVLELIANDEDGLGVY
jgi:hypothetical protein